MSFKKLLVIISIVIVVMFALMLTTSYAWYSFTGGSTTFDVVTNNDDIIVSFQKGEYINTNIAVPIKSEDVAEYSEKNNFAIKVKDSKVDNEMLVTISLVDINIDGALQNTNFKVELYHQNKSVASYAGNSMGTSGATTKTLGDVVLDNNVDNNFELRIYILDNGADQSSMMNKTFQAKIKIDVVSRLKTTMNDWANPDIYVSSISIDGTPSDSLPTSGYYTMSSICTKGSTLTWDSLSKVITYEGDAKINDSCSLTFTSSTDYPKLNTMPVGSYVAYVGSGGRVGSSTVTCKNHGSASSSTASAETEAPDSCSGQNAREDLDTSSDTYGYCYSANYKYYVTGWRIAYIDSNNKPVIVSAGSPECNISTSSTANGTYIQIANTKALKYCNTDFVDGNCTCTDSDGDGLCDSASTDAWGINDTDFYNITNGISGVGKRLTSDSSTLGDSGGSLGATLYCYNQSSKQECGYNNDIIDNGGYYWFLSSNLSNDYKVCWNPTTRYVDKVSNIYVYGLRPVISISSSVYVTGGSGTMDDPYTIGN